MPSDEDDFDPSAFLSSTALNENQRSFDLKLLADHFLETDARKRFNEIRKVEARIASLEKALGATEFELRRYPLVFHTEGETSFHEMEISASWMSIGIEV